MNNDKRKKEVCKDTIVINGHSTKCKIYVVNHSRKHRAIEFVTSDNGKKAIRVTEWEDSA